MLAFQVSFFPFKIIQVFLILECIFIIYCSKTYYHKIILCLSGCIIIWHTGVSPGGFMVCWEENADDSFQHALWRQLEPSFHQRNIVALSIHSDVIFVYDMVICWKILKKNTNWKCHLFILFGMSKLRDQEHNTPFSTARLMFLRESATYCSPIWCPVCQFGYISTNSGRCVPLFQSKHGLDMFYWF